MLTKTRKKWLIFSSLFLRSNMRAASSLVWSVASTERIVRISEPVWREAALNHANKIRRLLQSGLTPIDNQNNNGSCRLAQECCDWMTALDRKHPIYNFLIEYYGLKGTKGIKRLARWSPNPALLLQDSLDYVQALDDLLSESSTDCSSRRIGILLEGADQNDIGSGLLHVRGALPYDEQGLLYSPFLFYNGERDKSRSVASFQWYRSVLSCTIKNEPVLYCHGLHEWAMQYQPRGAAPPPSAKYQGHLPLRVNIDVINKVVERVGVSCTHIDALRFFAPAAGPLSRHGVQLGRERQVELENPACVHAHMDLLKMVLKIQPFVSAELLARCLEMALKARTIDVAASPYDASAYGVTAIPIETLRGREQYQEEQTRLMEEAQPVRQELLSAYDNFLQLAFPVEAKCGKSTIEGFAEAEL